MPFFAEDALAAGTDVSERGLAPANVRPACGARAPSEGLGVAMGNACEEVQEAADYVTGTNEEDGVLQVIRKFMLS